MTTTTFPRTSTFADHLQALSRSLARVLRSGKVPELVMASISEQTTLTPWLPGAPLTGLLLWSEHLTEPSWSAVVHDNLANDEGRPLLSLFVVGELGGADVALVASSYREVPGLDYAVLGRHQPVDADAVRELGALETPIDLTPEPAP